MEQSAFLFKAKVSRPTASKKSLEVKQGAALLEWKFFVKLLFKLSHWRGRYVTEFGTDNKFLKAVQEQILLMSYSKDYVHTIMYYDALFA